MELNFFVVLILTIWGVSSKSTVQKTPKIKLESGTLRGEIKADGIRGYYYSYLGIPYASASNRFQPATPVKKWHGTFEANDESVRCSQITFTPFYLIQPATDIVNQEDCLTLDVFTPVIQPGTALKPVMVLIFGGGFVIGSGSSLVYGPEYLIRNDVILVTLNYRVDIFGFLCLGINEAPGNVGFKDQVEALKWIKKNIKAFGGDPDNITLFGESAGAGSAMLHVVSPLSQGLFHKVIAQSGSSLAPWSIEPEPLALGSQIVSLMGHNTQDPKEIYDILMSKTADELLSVRVPRHLGNSALGEFIYGACVEKELEGVEPFLTDLPYNLFKSGQYAKVPMILGHNSHEGYLFMSLETPDTFKNMTFYDSLPKDLVFGTEQEAKDIAAELEKLYMAGQPKSKDTALQLADYVGDSQFAYNVLASADIISRTNDKPVFVYNFAYSGLLNFVKYGTGFGTAPGATHVDDLLYIFKHALAGSAELVESTMILKMSTMWTNFAKYGQPVPEETPLLPVKWQPITVDNQDMLIINTTFSTGSMWESEQFLYLNQTYSKYRRTTIQ